MSEKFTASNGVDVERTDDGTLCPFGSRRDFIFPEHEVALREFFLHERDEELGRWKSPTGLYVYPLGEINGERVVQVLDELNGQSHSFSEGGGFKGLGIFYEAANDYFAAHPVPKPWHDAVPGEAWVLTYEGREYAAVVDDDYDVLLGGMYRHILTSDGITAGRKIWPVDDA